MDIKDSKKYLRIVAVIVLLLAIFKGVFVLVLLIAVSLSMSYIVNNFGLRKIGLELVTFTGIYAAKQYGPAWGFLIMFVLITYHMVAGGFIGNYIMWVIPAYSVAAIIAALLTGVPLPVLGIYASIAINTNNVFFTAITSPGYLPNYMIYVITNILFNIAVFSVLGPVVMLI